jgi:hypothetical protein
LNKTAIFYITILLILTAVSVNAEDYTSHDFILRDPVVTIGGQRSTSTDFELFGSLGQLISGENTSASADFTHRAGWLYFALVTAPTISSATAGNTQVALSWNPSQTFLGAVVASYAVGQTTNSGGPYTFSDVGNALSSTRTNLTNGTTYHFVVQARDAAGQNLVQSNEVSITPVASAAPRCGDGSCNGTENCSTCPIDCGACPPAGGGGGGGGGIPIPLITQAIFKGTAYPQSYVTLLKDAQVAATTRAGADAKFEVSLSGLSAGIYTFGVWAEDSKGNRSITHTFTISITGGATTIVSGIFLPPSISIDKTEVKQGEVLSIMGQSAPSAEIAVFINSENELVKKIPAQSDGSWLYKFDTLEVDYGDHSTRARATKNNDISTFSHALTFTVGTKSVSAAPLFRTTLKGDSNNDRRVNLIDFSILAYWYKRPSPPATIDLNNDTKVDLKDFSIMAYYWTG